VFYPFGANGKGEGEDYLEEARMRFERLFQPITLLNMEVKNRFAMTSISNLFATIDGEVTQRSLDYYAARARGGVGLLIVEYANVQPVGKGCVGTMLGCYSDKLIPGLYLLARAIKENGARAALQIAHSGRQTFPEFTETPTIKAPSPIPLPVHGYPVPEEMTLEEIEETVEAFGNAALRVKNAGFDAVEVHGAHGYLPFGFFSPLQNQRKDKYGGSPEKRMRFGIEVVQRMREKVGPDYPIGYKLSGDEYLEGGITLKESTLFAKELEKAGINWLQCSAGIFASTHHTVIPMYLGSNNNVHLAEAMKRILNIPVLTVGGHGDPELMERILKDGRADMIAMGRQLVCDPELPNKIKKGQTDDIRRCIRCNEGCNNYFFKNWPITCSINAEVGREAEYAIRPTQKPKRVLTIGGGPAGMEAARVAALRGHDVTLFEKGDQLGGLLNVASVPEFKEPIRGFIRYQEIQLRKAGVKIELGKEGTFEKVKAFAPDAVIVATGGRPIAPSIRGTDQEFVAFAADVIKGEKKVGKNVLIVGGGSIGCETAVFLAEQGKSVTVAEMLEGVCLDAELANKFALTEMLQKNSVTLRTRLTLQEIRDREAIFLNADKKKEVIKADSIVLAMGYEGDPALARALENHVEEIYMVGDCKKARDLLGAFHDGAHIGRQV
jgi:2,4-dienoyl-CoA reductase-like NADH-dependent reductase (Old Yellow Enzyme family)/thioredoxin reductase